MSSEREAQLDRLAKDLKSRRTNRRLKAAVALGLWRDERAASMLKGSLTDKKADVRRASAMSLASLYAVPAELPDFQYLLNRLSSDEPVQRQSGIRGILALLEGSLPR